MYDNKFVELEEIANSCLFVHGYTGANVEINKLTPHARCTRIDRDASGLDNTSTYFAAIPR
jgi:hypothetical protein